jgi:hypothetical protein
MANTHYENFVLESKLTDLLNTKMNTRSFMAVDSSLSENPGMSKTINVYTYTGSVEEVAEGNTVAVRGVISFTPATHTAKLYQQVFDYTDEDIMADPKVLDMGMEGASTLMVNDLNTKYFAQLQSASLKQPYTSGSISYDTFVDAISLMNLEDEAGLFIVIGTDLKAALRKDADFTAARQGEIIFNGQIGNIAGIPVVVSKLVPANVAYIADKAAVTMFVKKDSEVEQARVAETRTNTVIMRKVGLVALTDATKLVAVLPYLAAPVITTASLAAGASRTIAGTCVAGATVAVYKNGVKLANATVTDDDWTYTIATVAEGNIITVVASKANFYDKAAAAGLTVTA